MGRKGYVSLRPLFCNLRSSSRFTPDEVYASPFPATLTTGALNARRLWRFDVYACTPTSRDLPSSLVQHRFHRDFDGRVRSTRSVPVFRVISRMRHNVGSHRVKFDVTRAGKKILLAVDQRDLISPFPQGTGAPIGSD